MALSIGVRKGSRLSVGKTLVEVADVVYGHMVSLKVGDKTHNVTDQQRTEILPDVFVSYGMNPKNASQPGCRLAFEAPRSVRILRV